MKDNNIKIAVISTVLDTICIFLAICIADKMDLSLGTSAILVIVVGLLMVFPIVEGVCHIFEKKEK